MYQAILYYKICSIANPQAEEAVQLKLCQSLNLKGRILISKDGINGTLGGRSEDIAQYVAYCNTHAEISDIDFKFDGVVSVPFTKLRVRARPETVATGALGQYDMTNRARHISIDTFHQWFLNKEDMVVLDMRNDYEWDIGRFKNSVRPPMKYFRDLKENLEFYKQYQDKKVVTFCTGGIRCELATPQLFAAGFKPENVYQLDGGIIKYAQTYGNDGFFEGKCFVFDDRIAIPVNTTAQAVIIGQCSHCRTTNDIYRNCRNAVCNKLFIACDACHAAFSGTCSEECQNIIADPSCIRPERIKVPLHRNK